MKIKPAYVELIVPNIVIIDEGGLLDLRRMGFSATPMGWKRPNETYQGAATLLEELAGMGIVFSDGPDWSPAQVIGDFLDRGLIHGSFMRIAWSSPEDWTVDVI